MVRNGTEEVPASRLRASASSLLVSVFSVKGTPLADSMARPALQGAQSDAVYKVTG